MAADGCTFSDDVIGHYFNHMLPDVMAGVDYLIDQRLVDGDRLGKRGYSAGGVLTKWTVTQTNRFKAAAAGAGNPHDHNIDITGRYYDRPVAPFLAEKGSCEQARHPGR